MVLNKGQSIVEGGENGETIHMDIADVEVPPHGTVILQTADESSVGVVSLTDFERGTVTITLRGQGTYPVPSGQQLVVDIPADSIYRGNTRKNNNNNIALGHYYRDGRNRYETTTQGGGNTLAQRLKSNNPAIQSVPEDVNRDLARRPDSFTSAEQLQGEVHNEMPQIMKAMVKMPEEVPKELIWNTTYHQFSYWLPMHKNGAVGGALKSNEMISSKPVKPPISGMNIESAPPAQVSEKSNGHLRPISYTTSTVNLPNNVRMIEGTSIMRDTSKTFQLTGGSALFQEDQPSTIITPQGEVSIKKGAVVQITVTPEITYVRDLYDSYSHDVAAKANGFAVELKPGQEAALVASNKARVHDLVYADNIARRDIQVISIKPNKHVAVSDFSHINLMMSDPLLVSMRKSQDANDKKLYGKLEKMAAVVTTVHDRTRAPYVVPLENTTAEQLAGKNKPQM